MMARDQRHSEYGGGTGSPQRLPDGSEKRLTVREAARLMRSEGLNASEWDGETQDTEFKRNVARRQSERNNGYRPPTSDV